MPHGFDADPHSQDGQACPRNYFGLTTYADLEELEGFYVTKRMIQLEAGGVLGVFDSGHLRKIHWSLFRDVFPWAGELRQVGLAKVGGAPFAPPAHIASALAETIVKLKAERLLVSLDRHSFAQRAAFYLGEINAIHSFREGNGRTQREFVRQLALHCAHSLSWAGCTKEQNTEASILSHTKGDNSGLAAIILKSMAPNMHRESSQ